MAAAGGLAVLPFLRDHTFLALALVLVGVAILVKGMTVDRVLRAACRADCEECPPPPILIEASSKFCHNPHSGRRTHER